MILMQVLATVALLAGVVAVACFIATIVQTSKQDRFTRKFWRDFSLDFIGVGKGLGVVVLSFGAIFGGAFLLLYFLGLIWGFDLTTLS